MKKLPGTFVYRLMPMKKLIFAVLLTSILNVAQAQTDIIIEDGYDDVVSYDTPVIYQSSIIYNAPVVYNAPVFYLAATTAAATSCASACYYEPQCEYRSPNVIIVGRGSYYTSWDTTPNVLIVGRQSQCRVTPARGPRR
jgi:hypothetical protein